MSDELLRSMSYELLQRVPLYELSSMSYELHVLRSTCINILVLWFYKHVHVLRSMSYEL